MEVRRLAVRILLFRLMFCDLWSDNFLSGVLSSNDTRTKLELAQFQGNYSKGWLRRLLARCSLYNLSFIYLLKQLRQCTYLSLNNVINPKDSQTHARNCKSCNIAYECFTKNYKHYRPKCIYRRLVRRTCSPKVANNIKEAKNIFSILARRTGFYFPTQIFLFVIHASHVTLNAPEIFPYVQQSATLADIH